MEQLLTDYEPYLSKLVNRYLSKQPALSRSDREDLLQEARLALCAHIRRIDRLEDIYLCHVHVISAMCRYKERMSVVHIPHEYHRREIEHFRRVELLGDEQHQHVEDDALTGILLDEYMDSLDEAEAEAVRMRLGGYTNREIGKTLGKSDWQTSRFLSRLARGLLRHIRGEGDGDECT